MPNGKKTTRDYVIEIHTEIKYVNKWIEKHDKKHDEEKKEKKKFIRFVIGGLFFPIVLILIKWIFF